MESQSMNKLLNDLDDVVKIACSDGNWNHDPYLHGMANGLICAQAVLCGTDPVYLDAPMVWSKDIAMDIKVHKVTESNKDAS